MFKFNWQDLVTDELVAWISDLGDVAPVEHQLPELRRALSQLLITVGGPPVVSSEKNPTQIQSIGRGLIQDGIELAFPCPGSLKARLGYLSQSVSGAGEGPAELITSHSVISINFATASELDALPGIGAQLAGRIISERMSRGSFKNLADLALRVDGIGEGLSRKLEGCLVFASRPLLPDFRTHLRTLMAGYGAPPEDALVAVLQSASMRCAERGPGRWFEHRAHDTGGLGTFHSSEWLGVLEREEYFHWLKSAFDAATERIEVAMFHIALGGPSHPSVALLGSLAEARERGVIVRVLVDRDRENDPYGSTIINRRALEFLLEKDVEARWDEATTLLHSKFVLIDQRLTVIGSHNWSLGSYASFGDISVAICSEAFTLNQRERFESLWSDATIPE